MFATYLNGDECSVMTEYKLRNKSGQLCGMLYRAQNRDLFYVILDTTNNQPHCIQLSTPWQITNVKLQQ